MSAPKRPAGQKKTSTRAEAVNKLTAAGSLPLYLTAHAFAAGHIGDELDPQLLHAAMQQHACEAATGDLSTLERMLAAQALTLNQMFCELARRAALNMGEHLDATEAYLRLALKAQHQSRATVETLAEIKNPRAAVAFVRQANISNGPQQVNNSVPAPAQEIAQPKNELLKDARHEIEGLDFGTQTAPARGNPAMEAVGAFQRAEN